MMTSTVQRIRQSRIERETSETAIRLSIDLDGNGSTKANTGVLFLDHMIDALGRHGRFTIDVSSSGDSAMDPHHTVEDVGIVLGQAIRQALGDKAGIVRFGFAYAPLDESLARTVVDCSGRPFLEYNADLYEAVIGKDFASSLIEEFWRAFAMNAGLTMHIDLLRSRNAHHGAEAIFKSAAIALRAAFSFSGDSDYLPSTKGLLA